MNDEVSSQVTQADSHRLGKLKAFLSSDTIKRSHHHSEIIEATPKTIDRHKKMVQVNEKCPTREKSNNGRHDKITPEDKLTFIH